MQLSPLSRKLYNVLLLIALLITLVVAHDGEDDDDDDDEEESEHHDDSHNDNSNNNSENSQTAYKRNVKWDTFHWLLSLILLLVLPSISAVLAFAERTIFATNTHIIATGYAVVEALFLRFNDPNGHENKTSRGTAWFLLLLLGINTFFGLLLSGSKFLPVSVHESHFVEKYGTKFLSRTYKTVSVLTVLTGWVKVCMAVVALLGFCYSDNTNHTGQCLAHGIMGSAFIGYGFVLLLVLIVPWFRNNDGKYPQEFWDSIVITVWGLINTFTEHRPWEPWSHGDFQHTAMGIIWWAMGLVGIYLSKDGHRSFVPGLVIAITGWAMSVHVQHLPISTKVHFFFGLALMFGGFSRIIEIGFLLKDKRYVPGKILSFQYFAPFSLVEAGLLFMGANEEQLVLVNDIGAGHSSYIMVITSAAFLIILWLVLLIELYLKLVGVDKYSGGNGSQQQSNVNYSTLENNPPRLSEEGGTTPSPRADDFELESLEHY